MNTQTTETRKRAPFASRKAVIAVGTALLLGVAGDVYIASPKNAVSTDNRRY